MDSWKAHKQTTHIEAFIQSFTQAFSGPHSFHLVSQLVKWSFNNPGSQSSNVYKCCIQHTWTTEVLRHTYHTAIYTHKINTCKQSHIQQFQAQTLMQSWIHSFTHLVRSCLSNAQPTIQFSNFCRVVTLQHYQATCLARPRLHCCQGCSKTICNAGCVLLMQTSREHCWMLTCELHTSWCPRCSQLSTCYWGNFHKTL
jgi:hypothetical protein